MCNWERTNAIRIKKGVRCNEYTVTHWLSTNLGRLLEAGSQIWKKNKTMVKGSVTSQLWSGQRTVTKRNGSILVSELN